MEKVFEVFITDMNHMLPSDFFYGEWVSFPTTKDKFKEVLDRLKLSPEQVVIKNTRSTKIPPLSLAEAIRCRVDFNEVNYFAGLASEYLEQGEADLLYAILDFTCGDFIRDNIKYLLNETAYCFFENIYNRDDLRKYLSVKTKGLPKSVSNFCINQVDALDRYNYEYLPYGCVIQIKNLKDTFREMDFKVPEEYILIED